MCSGDMMDVIHTDDVNSSQVAAAAAAVTCKQAKVVSSGSWWQADKVRLLAEASCLTCDGGSCRNELTIHCCVALLCFVSSAGQRKKGVNAPASWSVLGARVASLSSRTSSVRDTYRLHCPSSPFVLPMHRRLCTPPAPAPSAIGR